MAIVSEGNFLIVSDLQIPFEAPKSLEFCTYIKRHFGVVDENCYNVGDENDKQWAGLYKKDPDAAYTPKTEIAECIDRLKAWYAVFPKMKLAQSNHGIRDLRLAFEAGIPSQMLKSYERVIQAPPGWKWAKHWRVNSRKPFIVEHGDDYGGSTPHVLAAINNGCSTVIGHHHCLAGVEYVKTNGLDVWGAVSGCLIDFESYAFNYAQNAKRKPKLGVTVVKDGGRWAIWVPYE